MWISISYAALEAAIEEKQAVGEVIATDVPAPASP
jgi:hypothetical protein